jgi:hypothetical protein
VRPSPVMAAGRAMLALLAAPLAAALPPNFILLMSDDTGWRGRKRAPTLPLHRLPRVPLLF